MKIRNVKAISRKVHVEEKATTKYKKSDKDVGDVRKGKIKIGKCRKKGNKE